MRDRTAQTGPLTIGQQIVEWWESSTSASEPADLAERIDAAIAAEREGCATVADEYSQVDGAARVVGLNIGHLIRLRNKAT